MASKLTSADISEITRQSDVISKPVRDNFTNLKNKTNELVDEIAAAAIGTTNAETTAARPYHTNLKERLDQIWSGQYNIAASGGVVTINAGDSQKVDVTAFTGTIGGIQVKVAAATSGTIAYTSANTRYDVVVANSDSTFSVVTGAEGANPELPAVASTQKALEVLIVGTASVALGWDARDQGCIFQDEGKMAFAWKISDAVSAITSGTIFIGKGQYYEEVDLSASSDIALYYSNGAQHYRSNATKYCIKCVNSVGNEEENIKIINGDFYGNSKTGAIELVKITYTDKFVVRDCTFDGNTSSTATYKNMVIENCDIFRAVDNLFTDGSGTEDFTTYNISSSNYYRENDSFSFKRSGNDFSLGTITSPAVAALSSTRIAYIDATNDDLRTYDFDGVSWSQTGNDLNISGVSASSIAALSSSRIAFIDSSNADLRTYDFDGTDWSQTGNDLVIATMGNPAIAALSSSRIAFIDSTNADLRAYDFDGTDWSQTGNDLNIAGVGTNISLCRLSSSRIAFIEDGNDDLRVYDFDGTDWSQTGNDLNIAGIARPSISGLSSTSISFVEEGYDYFRVFKFDGTDWSQKGATYYSSIASFITSTSLAENRIVAIDTGLKAILIFDILKNIIYYEKSTSTPELP